jgi:tetratricopeptide (TPR) repeat protein
MPRPLPPVISSRNRPAFALHAARLALVALVIAGSCPMALAQGRDKRAQAREQIEKGTAAFALGNYSEAADAYENAFKLRPDAAVLYNAAQARRLAGQDERALELYKNYVRVYRNGANRANAQTQIEALERKREASAAPAPPPFRPEPLPVKLAASPAPEAHVAVTARPTPAPDQPRSTFRRPWFWVAVGAVAIGAGIGIFAATRTPSDPTASIGQVRVN